MQPAVAGAGLFGYLDGIEAAPPKKITEGMGDAAVEVPNPAYTRWWVADQKVLSLVLGSMEPDIACQLLGSKSAVAA
jgi:hypothetical protein